jgi:hypothetical protein
MDNFEKVEKLKERAKVSYEEARNALESCNWDMLDAMIYLEKNGRVNGPEQESYSTQNVITIVEAPKEEKKSFTDYVKLLGQWCCRVLEKGNRNSFCVDRNGEEMIELPLTVLVVLLLCAFWVIIPLLIVGLFFNMKYRFVGPDMHTVDTELNRAMDGAANVASNIKGEFTKE